MQKGCIIQAIYQTAAELLLFFTEKQIPHAIHVVKEGIEQLLPMNEIPFLITLKNIFLIKYMLQKSFD